MKKNILASFFLLGIIVSNAQVVDLTENYKHAIELADSGKCKEAIPVFESILTELSESEDTLLYYKVLMQNASCYRNTDQFSEALSRYKEIIQYYERTVKTDSEDYLSAIITSGLTFFQMKNFKDAEKFLGDAIIIFKKRGKEETREYAIQIYNLAQIKKENKQYEAALGLLSEALIVNQKLGDEKSISSANILFLKGTIHQEIKETEKAIDCFQKSLVIKESLSKNSNGIEEELSHLGNIYYKAKNYNDAKKFFLRLETLQKEKSGEQSMEYASTLLILAVINNNVGMPLQAKEYIEKAQPLYFAKYGNNDENYLQVCIVKAFALTQLKEYNNAADLFFKLIDYYKRSDNKNPLYIKSLVNLGSILCKFGQFTEAEVNLSEAQRISRQIGDTISADYSNILNNLATLNEMRGNFEQAEILYEESLAIAKTNSGELSNDFATTLSNLGLLYKSTGRFDKSENYLFKVKDIKKALFGEKNYEYATSLNNIASLFIILGRKDEAEKYFITASTIIKEALGSENIEYATVLNNLAALYEEQEKLNEALPIYREATSIIGKTLGNSHPDFLIYNNNLALLYQKLGDYTKAEDLYKSNLLLMKDLFGEKHPNYATFLSNLGGLYELRTDYSKAKILYEQALIIRKEKLGTKHLDYINLSVNLARVNWADKNFSAADSLWSFAINGYLEKISSVFPSLSEKEKEDFYNTIKIKIEQYFSYALSRQASEKRLNINMYNAHISTKAQLLNSSKKLREDILSKGDKELIEKYHQWQKLKESLVEAYNLTVDEQKERNLNIQYLENDVNSKEKELSLMSSAFKQNFGNQPGYADVKNILKSGEAAIEVIRFREYIADSAGKYTGNIIYGAFILKPGQDYPEFVLIEKGNKLESKAIKYYRNAIKFKTVDDASFDVFWKPIMSTLENIQKIYYSPDGVYNLLNINTLRNKDKNSYLVDDFSIIQLSNSKDILFKKPESSEKSAVVTGNPDFSMFDQYLSSDKAIILDPLPGTKMEAEGISGLLKSKEWSVKTYTEKQATEENIKSIDNAGVIHIATHGFFLSDTELRDENDLLKKESQNPLFRSGLYLAGANYSISGRESQLKQNLSKEDQILTAYEVMNLNLNKTNLVVLSACETGLGEVKNGEGVYGLQRSFQIAGARSVMISLWKVNDATTEKLMNYFYSEILSGSNQMTAFRKAQQKLKSEVQDPFFWGAFILIGE